MTDKQAINRSRVKLIILFLVFLVPVILAYIIEKHPQWQPQGTTNHGVLYNPTVRLKPFTLYTQSNKPYTLDDMHGKWSLIYIGGASCDRNCQVTLIKARDARWAQGSQGLRVHYYYILTADKFNGNRATMHKQFPDLIMLHGDMASRDAFFLQFRVNKRQVPGSDNRLYLVDPAGMLMMQYPYGFRHIGLMEDLKHLLRWSQIG